jgi:D-psicose/D-tagatose/L-ribulose 3-epimerase
MKYGIYYAYWEKQWGGEYLPYVERVANLGFDILEINCANLAEMTPSRVSDLAAAARLNGVTLTAGYGPRASQNIGSADPAVVANGLAFWHRTFEVFKTLHILQVGGGLYAYWPVDYSTAIDKPADWQRSVAGMRRLADLAADYGVTLCMEVLNRHEGYLLNTSAECVAYIQAVGRPNVKVHLDTYHMNQEEDTFEEALATAGPLLGHFHVGEGNRRLPFANGHIPWAAIGAALRQIGYRGTVVMEPFVLTGGQVGADVRVWRDLSGGASPAQLDVEAGRSLSFIKNHFERS